MIPEGAKTVAGGVSALDHRLMSLRPTGTEKIFHGVAKRGNCW